MKLPAGYISGQGVLKPTGYGGFGERMLRNMGWDKGQGLGKEGQGMKEAIEVKKKEDTVGVGGSTRWNWDDRFWERAFDSAVQTIGHDSSDSSSSDDDDNDDNNKNAARTTKGIPSTLRAYQINRDGTATTASMEELKLMHELSSGGRVAAGRFGGRDAKLERIRAQEAAMAADAAAKLGISSALGVTSDKSSETTSDAAAVHEKTKKEKKQGSKKKREEEKEKDSKRNAKKMKKTSNKEEEREQQQQELQPTTTILKERKLIVIEPKGFFPDINQSSSFKNFKATPRQGWWGASLFLSVGCLDGLKKSDEQSQERNGFTEAQQEQVYNAAQAGKTQGKVGLGRRSGPVKVGGVKWAGRKVSFDEEVEEEEERMKELHVVGSCTGLSTLAAATTSAQKQARSRTPTWASRIKWKKVLARALEVADGNELKIKAVRHVFQTALADNNKEGAGDGGNERVEKKDIEALISSSSKFSISGKRVTLQTTT